MKFLSRSTIFSSAFLLSTTIFVSKILGMARDRIFAGQFGAGDELDIYFAAFRIPDLVFNLLILGALSSAFIPVFVNYISTNKKEEAWLLTNSLLNIFMVATIVLCGLLFIFMDYLVNLFVPGFSADKKELTVLMSRIMILSPIFFCVSNVAGSILNSFKSFFLYSLAPIFYNLGIIFGALFLTKYFGIFGLAYGVILGAFLHMAIQLPKILTYGYRYRFSFDFKHTGVRQVLKLMIPRTMGLALDQINLWVITMLASTLAVGSISIFNLANNLQSFPISLIGVAFSVASFPYLAEAVAKNDQSAFKRHFIKTFSQILFFIIPASCLIVLMRAQIVRLVLGTGRFDWNDTYLTAQCLGIFAIGILGQALIHLLARTFYSLSDTKTPFYANVVGVAINIVLGLILIKHYGILGLGFGFAISSLVSMLLLFIILRLKFPHLGDFKLVINISKVVLASMAMSVTVYFSLWLAAAYVDMQTFLGIFLQAMFAGLVGVLLYAALGAILGCEEIKDGIKYLKENYGHRKN